jgi:hypothetical protein
MFIPFSRVTVLAASISALSPDCEIAISRALLATLAGIQEANLDAGSELVTTFARDDRTY